MKATPENTVKKIVKDYLNSVPGCFWYSASAGAYSIGGIPDIVGAYKGFFFGAEIKRPGGKPTALQLKKKAEIEAGGGAWFLIDGEDSLVNLKCWMKEKACIQQCQN